MYEYEVVEGLTVSFQRFPYPESGILSFLPPSRGALPIFVAGPARIMVPSPAGAAFWVALLGTSGVASWDVALLAHLGDGSVVDVLTGRPVETPVTPFARVTLPPHQFIPGIRKSAGMWWAVAREPAAQALSTVALDLLARTGPKTTSAVELRAGPTPLHVPAGPSGKQELSEPHKRPVGGAVMEAAVHVMLIDARRFSRLSVEPIPPSSAPDLGDRRLP